MTKKEIMNQLTEMNIVFNKKAKVNDLLMLLNTKNERFPETIEKHTAESTFAEKYEVEETAPVVVEVVEENTPEETEIVRIDPRVQTQEFIDNELAKRAEFIVCKYTPGMKRTTVLNRDNMRGMFYLEVQKKSVTFHSKHDMLPESLENISKVVLGNKTNPYAVKCSLDELARVLALYIARVERVRLERKTIAR